MRWFLLLLLVPSANAAQTFANGKGVPERFSVATTMTALTLPSTADYIAVYPVDVTGYMVFGDDCSDGGALPTDYSTVPQATTWSRALVPGQAVCIAGSGSGTVEVTPMDQGR